MTETVTAFPDIASPPPMTYEAAVQASRAEMKAAGLSVAQASREMGRGVSLSTLSKWLRGVYEGDVPAVTERVTAWLATRAEKARRDMGAAGLDRYADLSVTEDVEAALGHAQASGDIVLIHGRSGCGKSWGVARYCSGHSATYRLAVTGAVVTLAGLLNCVAAAVGAGADHPSALAAETAIVTRLERQAALLCVDEAHHLSPRLLDELRCIRDMAGCGLALIGGDDLWNTLTKSGHCEQIVGRIGIRLPVVPASEADVLELSRSILGREPAKGELKRLKAAALGAGGLHAQRRLLAHAWTIARAGGRTIAAEDIAAAAEAV